MEVSFLVALFLFLWFFHILRRNFFWIYFWQKRGSRFNRFLNGIWENKRILLSKSSLFALIVILISPFILRINHFFEILVYSFYLVLGGYALYLFGSSVYFRDFKGYFIVIPKFTKRIIFLFVFVVFLEMLFLINIIFQGKVIDSYSNLLFYFLVFEVFFSVFFLIAAFIFKFFSFFIEKIFERKAKRKIEDYKSLVVIGISGSYGKTLTKDFLYKLLSQKYKVLKTEGGEAGREEIIKTINTKLQKYHNIFICEISAYKKGEIKKICQILHPKVGILTGISEDHISLFGNFKNIINTNFELINCLPEDGVGIFNVGDKECQKLFQRPAIKKYSYTLSEEKGDVFAKDIIAMDDFLEFNLVTWKGEGKFKLNFPNFKYLESFLGAVTCALDFGIDISKIKEIAEKIKMPKGFLTKERKVNNVQVINDTLSQNPNGFFSALNYIKNFKGKKIIIASSISELGKASYSIHNNIGKKIGETCDLAIITSPFFFKEIKLGAISTGLDKKKILFLRNPQKILNILKPYFKKENVILLEGEIPDKIKEYLIKNDKES